LTLMDEIHKLIAEYEASKKHQQELSDQIAALRKQQDRVNHALPLPRTGIDYAFTPHPPADKLRSAGFSFACRYLTGPGKSLSEQEARELSNHGIDIVAIFEQFAENANAGYPGGVRDSEIAIHALNALHPKGAPPIYFAVDFEAVGKQMEKVSEYIRGCVHTIGWHRVGVYADFAVVQHLFSQNRCQFFWQTYAWSHQEWSPHAQLRQVQNGIRVFGADCDLDKAVAADFGQFRV